MNPPLRAALYGTGLLSAFAAGWLLKPTAHPETGALARAAHRSQPPGVRTPSKSAHPLAASGESWLDAASADLAAVRAAMQPGVVNQVLIDKLGGILSIGDASARSPQWQTVLTAMRAEDASAIKELFRAKAKDGRHFDSEFEAFCHRWGQLDGPAAAKSIVGEYAGKEQIVTKVMQGWGSRDAGAALAWASQQPGISQGTSIGAIVEGLGQRRVREAEALILANPGNPAFERIQGRIAALMVAQEGLSGTLPWFDQIAGGDSPDKFKKANLETLLKIANQSTDSSQAIQLARQYADRAWLPSAAGDQIGLAYLGQDPASSLGEIAKMPSTDAQTTATRIILDQWGPEATSEWLVANPQHPLFDTGALQLVEALAKTDPEAAAAWAAQIKDQKMHSFANTVVEMNQRNKPNPK